MITFQTIKSFFNKFLLEAGCDEAGRGCFSGPVFASAVILPKNYKNKSFNDSKQLTDAQRKMLRPIIEKDALAWTVSQVSVEEIDRINILNASILAMHVAIAGLKIPPQLLLIDGNRFKPFPEIPHQCIVKGDELYLSIAAASILAKTYRDDYMDELHLSYPEYGWRKNKGYGTLLHRTAIQKFGISEHHRKTFRLFADKSKLPL